MKTKRITDLSHLFISDFIKKDMIVIDATMGNGHDTLFLSRLAKTVYSFDIQQQALNSTSTLLKENNVNNCRLILDSHENILNHIKEFSLAVFNLGYLPNGDKSITTTSSTTLKTIKRLLEYNPKLKLIITCYPGHSEGRIESDELLDYLKNTSYSIVITRLLNKDHAPFIITIN